MSATSTSAIIVVYQYAMPGFSERLVGLLRAIFPEARVQCFEGFNSDQAKFESASVDTSVVVLVYSDNQALSGFRHDLRGSEPLLLQLPSASRDSDMTGLPVCRATDPEQLEEFLGQIAQRMQLVRAVEFAAHRGKVAELARFASDVGRSATELRLRRLIPLAIVAASLLAIAAGWKIWESTRDPPSLERFGFETGISPWQCQDAPGVRGCIATRQSSAVAKLGASSLEMVVDLQPSDPERRSGEIWAATNAGESTTSLDLDGRRVVAWVRPSAEVSGSIGYHTAFQIYAKDAQWRSCYGPLTEALPDEWVQLHLRVGVSNGGQFVEPGFDGHAIVGIGIKLALPTPAKSRASGAVYVDAISW